MGISENFGAGLDRESVKAVFDRVAARIARGQEPPSPILPADKAQFPKLLCLDQHEWIELAKAHYGRKGGNRAVGALEAIRAARASNRLVVSILALNIEEAAEPADAARRERLARFMVELSGNCSLVHHLVVRMNELESAVLSKYATHSGLPPIRPGLLHWGMRAAATGQPMRPTPDVDERLWPLVDQAADEPEFSVAFLSRALDQGARSALRERDKEGVAVIDGVRAIHGQQALSERLPAEIGNFLRGEQAQELLARMAISQTEFFAWLEIPEHLTDFAKAVPSLDVLATLMFARDRSPQDRTHHNDFKDFGFLGEAIPYGNIVVTENRWAHLANSTSTSLADRYETVVLADIVELPSVLASEDCL